MRTLCIPNFCATHKLPLQDCDAAGMEDTMSAYVEIAHMTETLVTDYAWTCNVCHSWDRGLSLAGAAQDAQSHAIRTGHAVSVEKKVGA